MPVARDLARRIRGGLRRRADRVLQRLGLRARPRAATPVAPPPPAAAAAPVVAPAPIPEPVAPAPVAAPEPTTDTVGEPLLTFDAVQAVLEDMVRPALQSDGGDIELLEVKDQDVYVRLVGACSTCPSSIVTMKMGVERLLMEEFPQLRSLIQVEDPFPGRP